MGASPVAHTVLQAVEQKQPRRAYERLGLRHPNLRTVVVAEHLGRPLRYLRTGNLAEGFDSSSRDPQRHRAEAGDHARERRDAITRLGQHMGIGETRAVGVRYEYVAYNYIVAAGAS